VEVLLSSNGAGSTMCPGALPTRLVRSVQCWHGACCPFGWQCGALPLPVGAACVCVCVSRCRPPVRRCTLVCAGILIAFVTAMVFAGQSWRPIFGCWQHTVLLGEQGGPPEPFTWD
jgi:hypothetical protein